MNSPDLRQLFGAGAQLFQQRRFEEAARVFRRAAEMAPESAPAWCNLAAACVEMRQPEPALAAADRAIALDPGFAPAHANRGDALRLAKRDLRLCRDAYQRAVELQPRSPDLLNKLATTEQALGELDAAGDAYERALALAPDFRLARLNYGCLLILQGRTARARELAQEAIALPGVRESDRQEFADALAIMDRNLALEPALAQALAVGSPGGLMVAAAANAPAVRGHDAKLAACVARCLQRLPVEASGHSRIHDAPDRISDMLEAHFSAHLGDDAAAARGTLDFLGTYGECARGELPSSINDKSLDAWNYYNAVRQHRAVRADTPCGTHTVVAWLRYWHAFLGSHRREIAPGQLKAFPNSVIINPDIERTAPALVEGTLEHVHASCAGVKAGAARAALVYYVIADVHPFADGNGRLGRFLMNRELEAAGLSPIVTPASFKPPFGRALNAIRRQNDPGPFVAWLASCDEYTRGIRAELAPG
jgi:tetratricopeptide (TPR) repeat protein